MSSLGEAVMHDYSIDRHPKEKILFVLALIAMTITPWVNDAFSGIANAVDVQLGWVAVPAVLVPTFLGFILLYLIFDRHLWRVPWLRRFLLVPDLNGEWECQGVTVIRNSAEVEFKWQAIVTIRQSWSKMIIVLRTG